MFLTSIVSSYLTWFKHVYLKLDPPLSACLGESQEWPRTKWFSTLVRRREWGIAVICSVMLA